MCWCLWLCCSKTTLDVKAQKRCVTGMKHCHKQPNRRWTVNTDMSWSSWLCRSKTTLSVNPKMQCWKKKNVATSPAGLASPSSCSLAPPKFLPFRVTPIAAEPLTSRISHNVKLRHGSILNITCICKSQLCVHGLVHRWLSCSSLLLWWSK